MKSLTPKEIKAELDNVHSTSAPAFAGTVYNWVNEFKCSPHVMHLVRDVQLRLLEIIDKIHDIGLNDQRVEVRELVEITGISQ